MSGHGIFTDVKTCSTAAAVAFGVSGGGICNFATQLKFIFDYDDALDIFAVHAIGGLVGNVCPTLFRNVSPCWDARHLLTLGAHGHFRSSLCRWRFDGITRHPGWLARCPLGPAGMAARGLLLWLRLFVGHDNHYPLGHALHPRSQSPLRRRGGDRRY
jgi:hypothetical protein